MRAFEGEMPATEPLPDDAADHRGYYFRRLLRDRKAWAKTAVAAVVLGVIAFPIYGPITAAVIFLLAFGARLLYAFNLARSKSADDFFREYAARHGLELKNRPWASLPPATPLLRKGVQRYTSRALTGELAPGVEGTLATYTYVTETVKGGGHNDEHFHQFTLAMTDIPGLSGHFQELHCQRKPGRPSVEGIEDARRDDRQRVELESRAFNQKFELFSAKGQDQIWLRRLFSPGFIDWLAETAPAEFSFEFADGVLVAYLPGDKGDEADLDQLRAAVGAVAEQLRKFAAEE
jgi:hypothetical protein